MKTMLLTALAITASVVIYTPSFAFHNSELDPAIKQQLAGAINKLEDRCAAGDERACSRKEEIREVGNDLAEATEDCSEGDQTACQTVQAARNQLGRMGQAPAAPGSSALRPKPRSTAPAPRTGNPHDTKSSGGGGVIGNPYNADNYDRKVIGNPYDVRNYVRDK
jgi:hypothetical protein